MAQKKRSSVFIGSSSEGLSIARTLQVGLDYDCEVTIWNQGVFGLSEGTLESLVKVLERFDFAILVLTPDDLIISRGETTSSARDNILFELGLFMGGIGRNRTFIVYDRTQTLKMPSDLAGVTMLTFAPHKDGNLEASLGAVCAKVISTINVLGSRTLPEHQITASQRVIGIPPRIFVTGGRDTKYNSKAFEAALEFGRLIAEEDVRLLSGIARGVDENFCRGATETFTARGVDVKQVLTCYTGKGQPAEHHFGKIIESRFRSRQEGIPEIISDSDIIITFGGAKNTHLVGVLALLESRFLFPIASTGGASSDLYTLTMLHYDGVFAGKLDKSLFTDLADLNNSSIDIARACVRAVKTLIRNI